ncbi:MAG: RecX family transcriptional regulator [Parachlamydiaceae bacterium]|nr:RecX family transcriptional regulator [Parachlamydiaceae bacterium]
MKVKLGDIDKYKNTYSLIIDEEVWQTVHLSIFGRSPSFPNTTEEELNSRFELLEYKGAKAFVLRRLSQKNYHSQELLGALAKRSVSKVTAVRIISEFTAQGYLNDSGWLSSFVRTLRSQRFGFKSILLKLMHRGITKEEASETIEIFRESESEEDNSKSSIEKLLDSRYRSRDLSDRKERDKVIAGLMRKGHDLKDIFEVLKLRKSREYGLKES